MSQLMNRISMFNANSFNHTQQDTTDMNIGKQFALTRDRHKFAFDMKRGIVLFQQF